MNAAPDPEDVPANGEPLAPDSPAEAAERSPSWEPGSAITAADSPAMGDEEVEAEDADVEIDPELIPLRERLLAARDYLSSRAPVAGQEEQFEDELVEIDEALRRIAEGAYGVCEYSGDPIPRERLAAQPWTRFTRQSQDKLERDGRKLLQISLPPDFAAGTSPL